ncbi:MAG: SET domain-containing protein-lysine N-methyltransferase [Bacteroidetes bacterium]|nr:SET domain-containing protein-lysine N-methyltransferase [Bacteroidota bacterium]
MNTTTVTSPNLEVVSRHAFADVMLNTSTHQKSLHATVAIEPGYEIISFHAGVTQSFPTYLTVQTGEHTHITLQPEFLQYINHSCEPNVFFDTTTMQLVCLRPLLPGDELTFFYPSTEWHMSQPFVCNCKTESCLQLINGAAHLDTSTLNKYRLTDFIKQKAAGKSSV